MTIKDSDSTANDGKLPTGFRFTGIASGLKASGKLDLSLIVSDFPVLAAGVYTQNQIVAAPVVLSRSRTPSNSIRAVVTNSGNANACTGLQGMEDAQQMCRLVADRIGCEPDQVLVMSTGVIGQPLPMEAIETGIHCASQTLAADKQAFDRAADAILTTDNARKTVFRTVTWNHQSYTIAAMAKGAGMIAPNMATMLGVILTDATLSQNTAEQTLRTTAEKSFNRISVDGHTSTNDTLLMLSSGSNAPLAGAELDHFQSELEGAAIELAKMLVADGEGASHVMAINVRGAANDQAAAEIAKTVAASPLVKTAITGGDPNWGRIVSAAGYARANIDPDKTSLIICGTKIYHDGTPVRFEAAALSRQMKMTTEVPIELTVGDGPGTCSYWSSDLTSEYVRFNSEYTT